MLQIPKNAHANVVRSVAQLAQFYMTIYTAYWGTISPPIIVVFGSVVFISGAVEIVLDYFFPNEQCRRQDTDRMDKMEKREGCK